MLRALHTILESVVDFAGLFPPAQLPLDQALREYARHRLGPHSWMLARFICPVDALRQVSQYSKELFTKQTLPWRFSVIGQGGEDMATFLSNLQADLLQIREFRERHASSVYLDALEMKIPQAIVESGEDAVKELVERAGAVLSSISIGPVNPFYEVGFGSGPAKVAAALTGLHKFNAQWAGEGRFFTAGAKLRTGGTNAKAFPSASEVGFFIASCRRLGIAFKATAGLHHPLRHLDESMNVKMHGFLNLYVAVAMAHAFDVELATLVSILECEDIKKFQFSDVAIRWEGHEIAVPRIVSARRKLCISFGSCSFDEPVTGLQQLGLMLPGK